MKRKLIVILSLITFLTLVNNTLIAHAEETPIYEIGPHYAYLTIVGASLSVNNGYATCEGNLAIFKDYDTSITITLQRSSNGTNWTSVKSWTESFSGIGAHSIEKEYYLQSGYTYRVLNTSRVLNGSTSLETATCYSPLKTY